MKTQKLFNVKKIVGVGLTSCILLLVTNIANAQWGTFGVSIFNTNSGNVGINQNIPNSLLHIKQNGTSSANGIRFETSLSTSEDWYMYMNASDDLIINNDANAAHQLLLQKNTGNMSLGNITPNEKLNVSGAIKLGAASGSNTGTIQWNGSNFQGYDGTTWNNLDGSGAFTSNAGITQINNATDDFLLGSAATGNGGRMIYNQTKNAFRGGSLNGGAGFGQNWDEDSLGMNSIAFGRDVKATGGSSIAMGYVTTASGDEGATALGYVTTASGNRGATALGRSTTASGVDGATALGYITTASGDRGATALGYATDAAGDESICIGSGDFSGNKQINNIDESLMIGFNSSVPTLFVGPSPTTTTSGNVGIGTTTPTAKLHVTGDVAVAGSIIHPSDKNLKENIETIKNGLSLINQLNATTYSHKADKAEEFGLSTKPQFGLIAQEVEEVIPALVIQKALEGKDGTIYKGLDYEKLIPILVAALQEEHAQKEALKVELTDKIDAQQNQINQILSKLNTEQVSK